MALQICGVQTQVFDDPCTLDVIGSLGNGQENGQKFDRVQVVARQTYFVVQSSSGADVSLMNRHVSGCFRELREDASIRYEGFVEIASLQEWMQAWKKTGKAGNLSVDINIYGPLVDLEKVGELLSKTRLYLQHPHHCPQSARYKNPHYLTFSNSPSLDANVPPVLASSIQGVLNVHQYSVSNALEDLHQREYLRQVEVDQRIRTPLLR